MGTFLEAFDIFAAEEHGCILGNKPQYLFRRKGWAK
ncbi:hypothetical protein CLAC_01250 [Corynebacterium lactis RW2-5]|uniref:Uncharacterized protein n=1 Tax=Corynebacterium lactis RW2-5 TaxID=1408189 RepID=A0A0K2H2U4_9CORY|nr:hypothetical protein CLAC_01250 [Corynebacterium lactis RW2-5]